MSSNAFTENLAVVSCAECGRAPRPGEVWRVYYADIGEAVTYCPECAEREFGYGSNEVPENVSE